MNLKSNIKFALRVTVHPFDCFWDLKHEKKGSMALSIIILLLLVVVLMLKKQATGYIFNYTDPKTVNIFKDAMMVLLPFFLWCVSNWCITTLVDGKGTFKDIVMTSAYSLIPLILLYVPQMIISNVMILKEQQFYILFESVAILWTAFLLFFGIMTIHSFTVGKTFITVILALITILVIVFLMTLFFSLLQQLFGFFSIIIREITMRL